MTSLYVIFFVVALILFAAIAGFSWWQQNARSQNLAKRGRRKMHKSDLEDPLSIDSSTKSSTQISQKDGEQDKLAAQGSKSAPTLNDFSELEQSGQAHQSEGGTRVFEPDGNTSGDPSAKAGIIDNNSKKPRLKPIVNKTARSNSSTLGSGANKKSSAKFDANGSLITELVARVQNTEPIEQHDLLTLFREYDFKFQRKVHIFGLNQMTEEWCDIEYELSSARFVELGLSIELADPRGAMTQKESHDFQQMTLELTNRFNANFEFSMGIDAASEQAQFLDEIGRRFDSMAVLNVVPKSKTGFRIADIESCARDLMMSTDKNGIFMKTQGHKHDLEVLYRLACTDGTGQFGIVGGGAAANSSPVHDLVIYMNVPATNGPDLVFQEMIKDANSLATWLDGRVVDKNGRAVSQRSYTALMKQIGSIADGMRAEGLSPGDAVSRKLF